MGGYAPRTAAATAAQPSTSAYEDGFIHGRLTRSSQGGVEMATLDKIRYHDIFASKPTEVFIGDFGREVTAMTAPNVTQVSERTSNFDLQSLTAILDCR